jgi:hypothetical protein
MVSGSDRFYEKWRHDNDIRATDGLDLHHLYRAMGFLGEALEDNKGTSPFSPRCTKDRIEEAMFAHRRDLFSGLEPVFFHTTLIYFQGRGGNSIEQ